MWTNLFASSSSPLDLLKSSTPITNAKISNKLRELAFKLDVEKKLKAGSERLAVLYKNDPSMGDKKNRAGVHGELLESNEKIVLLKRALQKYQQLFVPGMEDDGMHASSSKVTRLGIDQKANN